MILNIHSYGLETPGNSYTLHPRKLYGGVGGWGVEGIAFTLSVLPSVCLSICLLFSAKQFSEPLMAYCQLGPSEQIKWNLNQNIKIKI